MSLIPRKSIFDLDHFFDHSWLPVANETGKTTRFAPKVDIVEHKDAYEIQAELPGVEKKDIHVSLNNGILSIEASSNQEEKTEENGVVIRQERRYGKFVRSFDLGPQIQQNDISAEFKNGVLKLSAPKLASVKSEEKHIAIN